MSRRQRVDAGEDRPVVHRGPEGEDLSEPGCINIQAPAQPCTQRLDLGCKQQVTVAPAVEQGADPGSVSRQQQALAARVPERNGELTVEVREERIAVLLICVNDGFRIRLCTERVPTLDQGLAQL